MIKIYVSQIHTSVFRRHPWEVVTLSNIRFRIFNLSGIAAFIKHIFYYGFHAHRPKYWSTIARKSQLKYECPEPPYAPVTLTLESDYRPISRSAPIVLIDVAILKIATFAVTPA